MSEEPLSEAGSILTVCSGPPSVPSLPTALAADGVWEYKAALEFVRTPFAVRCNVVKVWRPLPRHIWSLLGSSADEMQSRRRERHALLGVILMAVALIAGCWLAAYRWPGLPRQLLPGALWVTVPPLAGWVFVRWAWIPAVTAGSAGRSAALAFARYLSGVYLYVYLMIAVGAALTLLLAVLAPARTQTLRYCVWLFLFGESFFVPAVMWLRLVGNDSSGRAFGRARPAVAAAYLVLFVVVPIIGMGVLMWA
jgi:hypothetical protein